MQRHSLTKKKPEPTAPVFTRIAQAPARGGTPCCPSDLTLAHMQTSSNSAQLRWVNALLFLLTLAVLVMGRHIRYSFFWI